MGWSGITLELRLVLNPFRGGDCILMYHGTPERDAAALARQLQLVRLFFAVVPLAEIGKPPRSRHAGRRRLALTFDDGLRSNVRVAYPILRSLGLTATFFVCPGLIAEGRWLWNQEARERLRSLPAKAIAELAKAALAPAAFDEPQPFVIWMKTLKIAERRRVEASIRAATPRFTPSAAQREQFDLATWEELKSLDPSVVTIGSHSMSHPILTSLSADEIDAELRESRTALERELGRPVPEFCYPNGNLDGAALGAARRYYGCAVTVEPGSLATDVDPHLMPRFAAQPENSLRLARTLAFA